MSAGRKRKPDLCDICRTPTPGRRYCNDHRDPRPLPPTSELLRWIEAQECPICRDGRSFKMLANHTVKAHGITGDEIRAAAGLEYEARICSPEFTEEHRERMSDNAAGLANLIAGRLAARKSDGTKLGARMRAYHRLAELHREDFLRLIAEERADREPTPHQG